MPLRANNLFGSDDDTLAGSAFRELYQLIMSGELPLGSVVNEVTLSRRFGISRGPIREAVQRLHGLRLVTREPHMRARVVSLSANDLIEIFQLREAVESMACRLAAHALSDEELARLIADLERTNTATTTRSGSEAENFDLHITIADGCGNTRIRQLLCEDLYHLIRLYRKRSGLQEGRHQRATEEHWFIVRALQMRDPDLAESLMRKHIGRATASLLATISV